MSITEIQQAITELSPEESECFRDWFEEHCTEMWDKQIETDAKSGRLNRLVAEADEDRALIEERHNEPGRPLDEYSKEKKN